LQTDFTLTALSIAPSSRLAGFVYNGFASYAAAPKVTGKSMVKIKLSISRKKYLKGKRVYKHKRGHLPVPSKILQKLAPYLKEDFQIEIAENDSRVILTYSHWKKPKQTHITTDSDHIQ